MNRGHEYATCAAIFVTFATRQLASTSKCSSAERQEPAGFTWRHHEWHARLCGGDDDADGPRAVRADGRSWLQTSINLRGTGAVIDGPGVSFACARRHRPAVDGPPARASVVAVRSEKLSAAGSELEGAVTVAIEVIPVRTPVASTTQLTAQVMLIGIGLLLHSVAIVLRGCLRNLSTRMGCGFPSSAPSHGGMGRDSRPFSSAPAWPAPVLVTT